MEAQGTITYPTNLAPRGEHYDEYPLKVGATAQIVDHYRFLEDPDSEATKAWVTAQNEITNKYLDTCELREKIRSKVTDVWNYEKVGIPNRHGEFYYFNYNSGLMNQNVQYRIVDKMKYKFEEATLDGTEVFLDPNTLSEDGTAAVSGNSWSEDGMFMAYQVKKAGSDWATIYVRDAKATQDLPDELKWVKFSGTSWTKDSKGFFYSRFESPESLKNAEESKAGAETDHLKNQKVYYHRVGTAQSEDVLIYKDDSQPDWMFHAEVSNDGEHLLLSVRRDTNEINLVYHCDLKDENNAKLDQELKFTPVIPDWIGGFDYIHNEGRKVYFKTNHKAPKSKIIALDLDSQEQTVVLAEHKSNVLQYAICIDGKLVVSNLEDASDKMKIYDFAEPANLLHEVKLPDIGTVVSVSGKHDDTELIYKFMSFTDPGSSYRIDTSNFETERLHVTKLAAGSPDPSEFVADQIKYRSKDGTQIPMFVVRKKSTLESMDQKPKKPIPTLLYGYGGFNIALTPTFSPSRLVFLTNLGGMLCIPSLRGGGEYGEDWHHQGTLDKKQNVFDDFIGAAEHLQKKGYTNADKTTIMGGSNGGLLVAAVANQRPEILGSVICQVPVADMLRFHKFTIGHFWCSDFGNAEKDGFEYLIKYSPLHNVKVGAVYPATMVLTADHDDRVVPLHTYKYVAELQHQCGAVEGQRPLLTRIEVDAGHGAGKPTHKIIAEVTDIYSFIAKSSNAEWTD